MGTWVSRVVLLTRQKQTGENKMSAVKEFQDELRGCFYSYNRVQDEWDYDDGMVQVCTCDDVTLPVLEKFCQQYMAENDYGSSELLDRSYGKMYMPLKMAVIFLGDVYYDQWSAGDVFADDIIRVHKVCPMDPTQDERFLSAAGQEALERIYAVGMEREQWTNEGVEALAQIPHGDDEDEEFLLVTYVHKHDPMIPLRDRQEDDDRVFWWMDEKMVEADEGTDMDALRYDLEYLTAIMEDMVQGLSYAG